MGFAHDSNNSHTAPRPDWLCSQPSPQPVLPFFRDSSEDICQTRDCLESVFFRVFCSKTVYVWRLGGGAA